MLNYHGISDKIINYIKIDSYNNQCKIEKIRPAPENGIFSSRALIRFKILSNDIQNCKKKPPVTVKAGVLKVFH